MDKNIAAFLREGTYTVGVAFPKVNTVYMYVCNIPGVQVDDYVVVPANGGFAVAQVVQVSDELEIIPNEEIQYKWIVSRVDLQPWRDLMLGNETLERTLARGYQANLRRSFAQTLMATLPEDTQKQLQGILQAPKDSSF